MHWDLSSVGGPADGVVLDGIVQEVDVATGNVPFEWHSLDQVPLSDSYAPAPTSGATAYDYFHVNSIDTGPRGDLLISGRATHTVYDVSATTGAISWRLGGKRSDFAMGPGTSFHSQHDAKWLTNTTITVFDNGAGVGNRQETRSRALILTVDLPKRTAILAPGRLAARHRARDQPGQRAAARQRRPLRRLGGPAHPVGVLRDRQAALRGPAARCGPVLPGPRAGFETTLSARFGQPYVAVAALDRSGRVLATSATVHASG